MLLTQLHLSISTDSVYITRDSLCIIDAWAILQYKDFTWYIHINASSSREGLLTGACIQLLHKRYVVGRKDSIEEGLLRWRDLIILDGPKLNSSLTADIYIMAYL